MKTHSVMLLVLLLSAISASSEALDDASPAFHAPLDFVQVAAHDQAGDYARANEEYLTLAAIGQAAADYNLGMMSLNGSSRAPTLEPRSAGSVRHGSSA